MSGQPVLPMRGGCPCGNVRYEITGYPLYVYTCNCTDCQRRTGSAFAINMPVRTRDFRIVTGKPKPWHNTSPKGEAVTSQFCGDCGGRLYGERATRAEVVNVRAGTLDDTSWLLPSAHFFIRSALRWVEPAPGAVCFETQPSDMRAEVPAWNSPDPSPRK